MTRTYFKYPSWMVALWLVIALGLFGIGFATASTIDSWVLVVVLATAVLALAACLEAKVAYLNLTSDSLRIRERIWSKRTIARNRIESVTWSSGCPVTLRLNDGTVAELPSLGQNSQGLINSIRAWLKNTP